MLPGSLPGTQMRLPMLLPILLASCMSAPSAPTELNLPTGAGTRVLFIGNSLTYTNDLPGALLEVALLAGDTLQVRSVAFPDFALEDHWNEGTARTALQATHWDFVVMQQGPSSLPENQVHLRTWTSRFAPAIRAAGATPALFMVWPSSARPQDFVGVQAAYRDAASAVGGIFVPAGEAWRLGLSRDAALPFYGADGFHPALAGTMLAALTIHHHLTGHDPRTLPFPANWLGLSDALWRTMAELAVEAH